MGPERIYRLESLQEQPVRLVNALDLVPQSPHLLACVEVSLQMGEDVARRMADELADCGIHVG